MGPRPTASRWRFAAGFFATFPPKLNTSHAARNPVSTCISAGSPSGTQFETLGLRVTLTARRSTPHAKLTVATLRFLARLRRWILMRSISCSVSAVM